MKIKLFILTVLSIGFLGNVGGQSLTEVKYKLDKRFISIKEYQPAANYEKVFMVFDDGDLYANELETRMINASNHFKARLVSCNKKLSLIEWQSLVKQLELDSNQSPFVIARGASAEMAVVAFLDNQFGLLLKPEIDSATLAIMQTKGGVLLDSTCSDSIITKMNEAGFWVSQINLEEPESLFESVNNPAIEIALGWADSLRLLVNDSLSWVQFSASAGLQSEIPEVLRQDKPLNLSLLVSQPANFRVEILNLSGGAVYSKNKFFGRGVHQLKIPTGDLDWGVYHVEIEGAAVKERHKIIIRG